MAERVWLDGLICFIDQAEIKSPMIGAVAAKRDEIRRDRAVSSRRDIDPIDFKKWLPYLSLADSTTSLFGCIIGWSAPRSPGLPKRTSVTNGCMRPKWLHETDWNTRTLDVNHALYRRMWDSRTPVFGLSTVEWDRRQEYSFEWGLFPLSDNDSDIAGCLSVDDFTPIAGRSSLLR